MTVYAPGTAETDPKKQNRAIQAAGAAIATNTTDIATANTNIATANTNIATNTSAIAALQALVPLTTAKNSLGADVLLNNIANFFDGPSMAQGTSGTWFVSGQVTCIDTGGAASFVCKLWDGTTVIDSALATGTAANVRVVVSLSGILASPAANIRISVQDGTNTTGKILFNASGLSKDSSIFGIRIA